MAFLRALLSGNAANFLIVFGLELLEYLYAVVEVGRWGIEF